MAAVPGDKDGQRCNGQHGVVLLFFPIGCIDDVTDRPAADEDHWQGDVECQPRHALASKGERNKADHVAHYRKTKGVRSSFPRCWFHHQAGRSLLSAALHLLC